jgi:predicted nucleic acid-binding protein
MALVVDASLVAHWLLPDEAAKPGTPTIDGIKGEALFVPAIFWYELRNIFIVCERRSRLSPEGTSLALSYVQALDISIDFQHDDALILSLARTHALTVYDAAYLELALRKRLPLLTLDTKLNLAFLAAASS